MVYPSRKIDYGKRRFRKTLAVARKLYGTLGDLLILLEDNSRESGSAISQAEERV